MQVPGVSAHPPFPRGAAGWPRGYVVRGVSMAGDPIRLSYMTSHRIHGMVLARAGRGAGLVNDMAEIKMIANGNGRVSV